MAKPIPKNHKISIQKKFWKKKNKNPQVAKLWPPKKIG